VIELLLVFVSYCAVGIVVAMLVLCGAYWLGWLEQYGLKPREKSNKEPT